MGSGRLILKKVDDEILNEDLRVCVKSLKDISLKKITRNDESLNLNSLYERNVIISLAYNYGCKYHDSSTEQSLDILINGEIQKKIINLGKAKQTYKSIKKTEMPEEINVYPDFIIHTDYSNKKDQKLILEAKATRNLLYNDFKWDFFKLNFYIESLDFKTAVYLIIGLDETKIQKRVDSYCSIENVYLANKIENLFIISIEDIESKPNVYKFYKSE